MATDQVDSSRFEALNLLTKQVQAMAEKGGGGHSGKKWDNPERYKNLKTFDGST